jgi:beta-N-acetylhexosaminidase
MKARRATATLLGASLSLVLVACAGQSAGPNAGASEKPSSSAPSPTAPGPSGSGGPSGTPSTSGTPDTEDSPAGGGSGSDLGTGWGPTPAEIRRAERLTHALSLEDLAGQVIVAQYNGLQAPSSLVDGLHLGGVIVMSDNIGGTDALRHSNRALQAAARKAGRSWPVFVGVDQEGGVVERVKGSATRFPSFMSAGAAGRPDLTEQAAASSGAELVDLGFSAVFAPDGDVTSGPDDPTIGSRSASSRPKVVAEQMNAAVDGYLSAGILPVVKHFPGHGSVDADSHVELPVQRKTLAQLRRSDLVPFESAVARGVPALMVGHLDVRAVDPGVPASLSHRVVTGLLRKDLGFDGLVVSDAMNMGAVTDRYSSGAAAVRALQAGVDVVLMPVDPRAARDGIVRAVERGRLDRSRLEDAAARQVAVLLHEHELAPSLRRRPGSSETASYRLSAAAATVVSGPCSGRLVGRSVRATGSGEAVARFYAAAGAAGLGVGSGTSVALVGYGGSARSADVVVTTDTPYALGSSRARVARIAVYGDTPGAMRALVQVLLGKARAPGRLPVPVPGVERSGC